MYDGEMIRVSRADLEAIYAEVEQSRHAIRGHLIAVLETMDGLSRSCHTDRAALRKVADGLKEQIAVLGEVLHKREER